MNFFSSVFGGGAATQVKEAIANGAMIVDVRTPAEFAGGHAKGAVNIPLDRIPYELDAFKNKPGIIVYCRSGNRSGQAKAFLDQQGISNVLNGGTVDDVSALV